MINPESLEIVLPATIAGLMVAILHVPLGIEVLRRGIIFIDLAIAQIAGLCVVLVKLWVHDASWAITQIAAILSALAAALFLDGSKRSHHRNRKPSSAAALSWPQQPFCSPSPIILTAAKRFNTYSLVKFCLCLGSVFSLSYQFTAQDSSCGSPSSLYDKVSVSMGYSQLS